MITYTATIDGAELYGPDDLQLIQPKLTQKDNAAGSFEFTIAPDHPAYGSIDLMTSEIAVFENGAEIWAGRPVEAKKDFYNQIKYYCEGELAYFNDSVQPQAKKVGYTVQAWLEYLISIHNAIVPAEKAFAIGIVTVTDANAPRFTNFESTMKCLNDLIKANGGHMRIRHENGVRLLDYLANYPGTATQHIEFGQNLLDFSQNFNLTDIATAVVPLGAKTEPEIAELEGRVTVASVNQGSIYVLNQDLVQTYGQITKTIIWDDITEPSDLLTAGQTWLTSGQFANAVFDVKAIDLKWVDDEVLPLKLLDQIRVISTPHGLDAMFPLTTMTLILNDPSKNTYRLGKTEQKTLTEKTTATAGAVSTLTLTEPMNTQKLLDLAQENATKMLKAVDGGYVIFDINETTHQPYQILIMDAPNKQTAQNVIRMNQAGIGFSTHGYDGPYDTAWTIDGAFNATYITAGTLVANLIKAGVLSDVGGNNSWNLETGAFQIRKGSISISTNSETQSVISLNFGGYTIELSPFRTSVKKGNLGSELYLNGFRTENNNNTTFDVVTAENQNYATMTFKNGSTQTVKLHGNNGSIESAGNITAAGTISATTGITSSAGISATGNISAGGNISATGDAEATGKVTAGTIIGNANFKAYQNGTTVSNNDAHWGCTGLDASTAEASIVDGYLTLKDGIRAGGDINADNKDVYAANFVQVSDRRRKKDIKPLPDVYESLIDKLEPVLYKYIARDEQEAGLIAQDVLEVEKELGIPDDFLVTMKDGFYSIKYNNLFALILKRLKGVKNG